MAKIIVIDDEEMIRSIAERILKKGGHEVLTAENGRTGIEKFNAEVDQIDIVICDINMDDLSGFDVLREIRKSNRDIPGIVSSGNPYNPDDVPKEINEHIYFLQKPYRASQLTELIQSILVPQS